MTVKTIDLLGVGNGIVDLIVNISEEDFDKLGYKKNSFQLVSVDDQARILADLEKKYSPTLVSGGSVGNSIILFSALGARGGFSCCLGDDRYGLHYRTEFEELGISLSGRVVHNKMTGTCLVLVTPDAHRTMVTSLGVALDFNQEDLDMEVVKAAKWVLLEGYPFANSDAARIAVTNLAKQSRDHGAKVALSLSDPFIAETFKSHILDLLPDLDLVIGNEHELVALSGESSREAAYESLAGRTRNLVMTMGGDGVLGRYEGENFQVSAYPCTPKDLTGAGDAFAGTFLYGVRNQWSPSVTAKAACYIAMKVVQQVGARMHLSPKSVLEEVVRDGQLV